MLGAAPVEVELALRRHIGRGLPLLPAPLLGIRFMFTGVVQNFVNFDAVGVTIVAMVGVGVAEAKGPVKALMMIAGLPVTGVITVAEAIAGFGDPDVVLITALFVLGEGLARTGVAQQLGDWLDARAGNGETRPIVL